MLLRKRAAYLKAMAAIALVAGFAAGTNSANATTVYVTYTGTVERGIDNEGLFGAVGADLANMPFVAQYAFYVDESNLTYETATQQAMFGYGAASPSLGADLSINSHTLSFSGAYYGRIYNGNDGQNEFVDHWAYGDNSLTWIDITLHRDSCNLTSCDYPVSLITPYSLNIDSGDIGSAYAQEGQTAVYLIPTHIRVSLSPPGEVPLPAALPLFGSGLGGMGLLIWRRRRKAAAALAL